MHSTDWSVCIGCSQGMPVCLVRPWLHKADMDTYKKLTVASLAMLGQATTLTHFAIKAVFAADRASPQEQKHPSHMAHVQDWKECGMPTHSLDH